jgi:transcriptional regulator with XRE-family HTH domain
MQRWHTIEDLNAAERHGAKLLGAGIRGARLRRGLSQQQLAWHVGLSQSMISRVETGHLRGIRFRMLARVAGALSMGADWLVAGGPPPPTRRLPGEHRYEPAPKPSFATLVLPRGS